LAGHHTVAEGFDGFAVFGGDGLFAAAHL
jgi:hypothetical protein